MEQHFSSLQPITCILEDQGLVCWGEERYPLCSHTLYGLCEDFVKRVILLMVNQVNNKTGKLLMIYFPESAARAICKTMRDIHSIHRHISRRSGQSITSSVQGFLIHCTNNTVRGVLLGMIPSKNQCYIRAKFTPIVVGLISSLPAHTSGESNLCQSPWLGSIQVPACCCVDWTLLLRKH